ncbi:hypothetical protein FQZ97_1278570 [compost metagenome]
MRALPALKPASSQPYFTFWMNLPDSMLAMTGNSERMTCWAPARSPEEYLR